MRWWRGNRKINLEWPNVAKHANCCALFHGFVKSALVYTCLIEKKSFQGYVLSLPSDARPFLKQRVDLENEGVDLGEIAEHMLDWEKELSSHLGLSAGDVHKIKAMHADEILQRYSLV